MEWFKRRITQKSTWYGIGAIITTAATNGSITPELVVNVMVGLGLVSVDA